MHGSLHSTTAIVTGASRGLGRAYAIALAREGARVVAVARSRDDLEETVAAVHDAGGEAVAAVADVTSREDVERVVSETDARAGGVDVLVNNAGLPGCFGPLWETDPDEWWRTIEVNVRGPMLWSRAALPGMIRRKRGRIINVASGSGTRGTPYMACYITSKTALIRFSEILATEAREHGIAVFAIEPGAVLTAMGRHAVESETGRRWIPWAGAMYDEHGVTAEQSAAFVVRLARGDADALSGRLLARGMDLDSAVASARRIADTDALTLRMRPAP